MGGIASAHCDGYVKEQVAGDCYVITFAGSGHKICVSTSLPEGERLPEGVPLAGPDQGGRPCSATVGAACPEGRVSRPPDGRKEVVAHEQKATAWNP